jgi:hypothetical protein
MLLYAQATFTLQLAPGSPGCNTRSSQAQPLLKFRRYVHLQVVWYAAKSARDYVPGARVFAAPLSS